MAVVYEPPLPHAADGESLPKEVDLYPPYGRLKIPGVAFLSDCSYCELWMAQTNVIRRGPNDRLFMSAFVCGEGRSGNRLRKEDKIVVHVIS